MPIRSPFFTQNRQKSQNLGEGIDSVFKLVNELNTLKERLNSVIEENNKKTDDTTTKTIQTLERGMEQLQVELERVQSIQIQGEKGDSVVGPVGSKGEKGDSIKGEKGDRGPQGIAGRDGETPIKGIHYFDGKSVDPEEVLKLIEKKKLSTKHIDGLEQTLHAIQTQTRQGYLHGGGVPSLSAGANITLTPKSDGGFTITGTAGGGTFIDNEVVAGDTNTFTLANVPIAGTVKVFALGQRLTLTVDYSLVGAIITTVNVWNTGEIVADYQK